ncbi:serine hydrolase [Paenibacillus sp. P36]|uniref:serine hydrolase n=1 Tax=Paenibacillus sp. P36 TaxID=3342538 RepID=UPI0038B29697
MNLFLGVSSSIVLIICLIVILVMFLKKHDEKKNEQDVLNFFEKNPNKSSICFIQNDVIILDYSSNNPMPLASTVKVIIAIAYANKVNEKKLAHDSLVPLSELNKYYISKTDGNAHEEWLSYLDENSLIYNNSVELNQIVKGMIRFSSNANTEYLISIIGLKFINDLLKELSLESHEEIFPISSSFMVAAYLKENEKLNGKEILLRLKMMANEEFIEISKKIHNLCHENDNYISSRRYKNISSNNGIQRVISNKMTRASTYDYANVMNKINSKNYFPPEIERILLDVLDIPSKANSQFYRVGYKGGSTLFINTNALYVTDTQGNRFALAIFIHDEEMVDILWLNKKIEKFISRILKDVYFREDVISRLSFLKC